MPTQSPLPFSAVALVRALIRSGKARDLEHAAQMADNIIRRAAAAAKARADAVDQVGALLRDTGGYAPERATAEAEYLLGSPAAERTVTTRRLVSLVAATTGEPRHLAEQRVEQFLSAAGKAPAVLVARKAATPALPRLDPAISVSLAASARAGAPAAGGADPATGAPIITTKSVRQIARDLARRGTPLDLAQEKAQQMVTGKGPKGGKR